MHGGHNEKQGEGSTRNKAIKLVWTEICASVCCNCIVKYHRCSRSHYFSHTVDRTTSTVVKKWHLTENCWSEMTKRSRVF